MFNGIIWLKSIICEFVEVNKVVFVVFLFGNLIIGVIECFVFLFEVCFYLWNDI